MWSSLHLEMITLAPPPHEARVHAGQNIQARKARYWNMRVHCVPIDMIDLQGRNNELLGLIFTSPLVPVQPSNWHTGAGKVNWEPVCISFAMVWFMAWVEAISFQVSLKCNNNKHTLSFHRAACLQCGCVELDQHVLHSTPPRILKVQRFVATWRSLGGRSSFYWWESKLDIWFHCTPNLQTKE